MIEQILHFLLFVFVLIAGMGAVFGLITLDKIVLQKHEEFKKISKEIIQNIRDIKNEIKKINKFFALLKDEKLKKIKKIIDKTIGIIDILMLFFSGKEKFKLGKYLGLKIAKAFLMGVKIYNS